MNIRFNGCGDPADFLLRKSADNEGRAEPVHPVYWSRAHNSWEDYKAAAIAAEDKFKQDEAMSVRFSSMPLRAVLAVLPGLAKPSPSNRWMRSRAGSSGN